MARGTTQPRHSHSLIRLLPPAIQHVELKPKQFKRQQQMMDNDADDFSDSRGLKRKGAWCSNSTAYIAQRTACSARAVPTNRRKGAKGATKQYEESAAICDWCSFWGFVLQELTRSSYIY